MAKERRAKKGTGRLFKRGANFYLELKVNGTTKTKALRNALKQPVTTKPEADALREATAESIRKEILGVVEHTIMLDDIESIYRKYLPNYSKRKGKRHQDANGPISERSLKSHIGAIKQLVTFLKKQTKVRQLEQLSAIEAEAFMVSKAKLKAGSFNIYLYSLRHVFDVIPYTRKSNPFAGVRPKTTNEVAEDKDSKRRFSPEELMVMQKKASGWIRCSMLMAYKINLRLGDVVTFKLSDITEDWLVLGHQERKTSKVQDLDLMHPSYEGVAKDIKLWIPQRILDWNCDKLTNSEWIGSRLSVGRATAYKLLSFLPSRQWVDEKHWQDSLTEAARTAVEGGMEARGIKQLANGERELKLEPIPKALTDYLFPRQADAYLGITRKKDDTLPGKQFMRFLTKDCKINVKSESGQTVLGFHSLRTEWSTEQWKRGKSIESIQKGLGHSSRRTTDGYIQPSLPERKQLLLDERKAVALTPQPSAPKEALVPDWVKERLQQANDSNWKAVIADILSK